MTGPSTGSGTGYSIRLRGLRDRPFDMLRDRLLDYKKNNIGGP